LINGIAGILALLLCVIDGTQVPEMASAK